ncbi:M23 family metallopeptidase [Sphingomonas sp. KR1UV-12]|uniref:M23 family metallopeptidase n=1 Tax=Sphingomonas aurea TaxID=3063994 RepID=A0ABT9EJ32_9SPHN|nr:M23 family metallopeptidase [Sphingomonas sp. KR1UV-12]MDP1026954.1 M23 family metallopeptidase [Sphingomonas sp. KR1UV-12]
MRAALAGALLLAGCVAPPAREPALPAAPAPAPIAQPPAAPVVRIEGPAIQGGLLHGQVTPGATLTLDGRPVPVAPDGAFVIGFDRDAPPAAVLVATRPGTTLRQETRLPVAPRDWKIERVDAPYRAGRTSEEFAALRPGELAQIVAARAMRTDATGWRQRFVWPARGRQSGWFGSQRVYQGQPGSYHSGADVAVPTGTPVIAPADGVVILAAERPFTLEGNLLMIDHGMGVSTALLHLSRIDVRVGDHVRQGQPVALSGATGRVTGPHLHWGLQWSGAKLDPLLVVGVGP